MSAGATVGEAARVESTRSGLANRLATWVLLFRPRQLYKNLIVFVPLVFSNNALTWSLWPAAVLAFVGFALLSGGAYAFNDVRDQHRDRLDPVKVTRPVASGRIGVPEALLLAGLGVVGGLLVLWLVNLLTLVTGMAYLLLQVAYNLAFKDLVLWDLLLIAVGFVLRALGGTAAIGVGAPTEWLIVTTFLFAFYLALAKRRRELLGPDGNGSPQEAARRRPVLAQYTVGFIEQTMQIATALLLAAYALYTFFGTTPWMMFTIPFAFYGILRHNLLVRQPGVADDTQVIFRDRSTLLNVAAWVVAVVLILQGVPQDMVAWLEGFS